MENKKDSIYMKKILEHLLNTKITTSSEIAQVIGLSEKTTRNKIESTENYLVENNLGSIRKKPRVGIWLETDKNQRMKLNQTIAGQIPGDFALLKEENKRELEIKRLLLKYTEKGLSVAKLAEELFISVPTVHKHLKNCEFWFQVYELKVDSVRNKGLALSGTEANYRIALKDFILHEDNGKTVVESISYFFPGIDMVKVHGIINNIEKEWGLKLNDSIFNELLINCHMIVYRHHHSDQKLSIEEAEGQYLKKYNEFNFAAALLEKVSKEFTIELDEMEVLFLSQQILSRSVINSKITNSVKQYDEKLEDLVEIIIDTVGNIINIDFSEDEALKKGLLQHIRPLIFRIKYGRKHSDSLVSIIKKEYKQVYRAVWSLSVLFEEYYNMPISEDELGYIVLYFQAAIERNQYPLKIVLISHMGVAHNQLIIEGLKKFYRNLKDIVSLPQHSLDLSKYEDYDIILTTGNIMIDDKRALQIDTFLTEKCLNEINLRITKLKLENKDDEEKFDIRCHQLFEPDLIFLNLGIRNKKEILVYLTEALKQKGYVTGNYLESVLERENATYTSIGNGVAIPHGNQNEINEAKVVIATLEHPVEWNEADKVEVIFLLAVKMNSDEEVEKTKLFYKQYISLVETDEKVNELKNMKSNIDFYKYLIR